MSIQFAAEIKELKCRTGCSGDMVGRLVLEFIPYDEIFNEIKKVYGPQEEIIITIEGHKNEPETNVDTSN